MDPVLIRQPSEIVMINPHSIRMDFPEDPCFLPGFGEDVEVLEPASVRSVLKEKAVKNQNLYKMNFS